MRSTTALAALTVLAAAACGNPFGVEPAGIHVLESVAGEALPTPQYQSPCVYRVVADTLVLFDNGTGERRTVNEGLYEPGKAVDPNCTPNSTQWHRSAHTSKLSWVTSDDRIQIEYYCPPNALCVAGPHLIGRVNDEGIVFETVLGGRTPLVYRRIL